jgi:hypothetical protein
MDQHEYRAAQHTPRRRNANEIRLARHQAALARIAKLETALRYVAQGGDGDTEYLATLAKEALKDDGAPL